MKKSAALELEEQLLSKGVASTRIPNQEARPAADVDVDAAAVGSKQSDDADKRTIASLQLRSDAVAHAASASESIASSSSFSGGGERRCRTDTASTITIPSEASDASSIGMTTLAGAIAVSLDHVENDDRSGGGPSTAITEVRRTPSSGTYTVGDHSHESENEIVRTLQMATSGEGATHSLDLVTSEQLSVFGDIAPETPVSSPLPLLEAELVISPPVVQAYLMTVGNEVRAARRSRATGLLPSRSEGDCDDDQENGINPNKEGHQRKSTRPMIVVSSLLCCIVITMSILIPLLPRTTKEPFDYTSTTIENDDDLWYDCYKSTRDLVRDQRDNPQPNDVYILCPGTRIRLGNLKNPQAGEYFIIDGDYPLTALRANVTIQCGLDGNVENHCVLDGGFLQVILQSILPPVLEESDCALQECAPIVVMEPVDNFHVRGITFTGIIDSGGPVIPRAVTVSHPGGNIRFENCLWKDMSASHGLVAVGYNYFQELAGLPRFDDQSTQVTFVNSRFENIVYDTAMFFIESQSITLEDCAFRNVEVSVFHQRSCTLRVPGSDPILFVDGCAGLLYCGPGSRCTIDGVCFENFEVISPALIIASEEADLTVSNAYWNDVGDPDFHSSAVCQVGWMDLEQGVVECQADVVVDDRRDVFSCDVPRSRGR